MSLTANQATTGAIVSIDLDTVDIDTDGYADLAGNRFVIPGPLGGRYRVTHSCMWATTAAVPAVASVGGGGAQIFWNAAISNGQIGDERSRTITMDLAAGQTIDFLMGITNFVGANEPGTFFGSAGPRGTFVELEYLGR